MKLNQSEIDRILAYINRPRGGGEKCECGCITECPKCKTSPVIYIYSKERDKPVCENCGVLRPLINPKQEPEPQGCKEGGEKPWEVFFDERFCHHGCIVSSVEGELPESSGRKRTKEIKDFIAQVEAEAEKRGTRSSTFVIDVLNESRASIIENTLIAEHARIWKEAKIICGVDYDPKLNGFILDLSILQKILFPEANKTI